MTSAETALLDPESTWSALRSLRKWLDDNNCALERGCREKESHMSLAGGPYGRLLIPPCIEEAWLEEYAKELSRNVPSLFFTERRTPVFRMHFDLDFTQPTVVTLEYLSSMAKAATDVFRPFFPKLASTAQEFTTVILTAPPKPVRNSETVQTGVKSGCHLMWPWLYVDQGIALQLRLNLVEHLTRTWPSRDNDSNPYSDVVDESVLKGNGLRMYGSHKASKCKQKTCKSKRSFACNSCSGMGFVVENRAYTLATILDPMGAPDTQRAESWKADLLTCVRHTTTRTSRTEPTPGFAIPDHAVTDATVTRARKAVARARALNTNAVSGPVNSEVVDNPSVVARLKKYITTITPMWRELEVKQVFLQREKGLYTCKVSGPGSSYCTNSRRAHGSNTIYFVVNRDGIYQKCFSLKTPQGRSCPCRAFTGVEIPLDRWLREAMFGSGGGANMKLVATISDTGDNADLEHPKYPGLTFREHDHKDVGELREIERLALLELGDPKEVYALTVKDGSPIENPSSKPDKASKKQRTK